MKEHIVTQKNELVEAHHIDPLSVNEQKVVLTMISMIEPADDDFKTYLLSVKDFAEMVGLKGESTYSEIKKISKTLVSKVIEIPIGKKDWLVATWASSVRYRSSEGTVEFSFDSKLKPYLLQLKNQFTSYKLTNILNLKSTYSIRLYELMKKWQHLGRWECSVEELRGILGAKLVKSYSVYGNFKNRVLLPALVELNDKTDVQISFSEIKKGRKVERIEFTIRHAPEKEIKLPESKKRLEQPKKAPENEEVRIRLNRLADKELYQFDPNYFSQMYEAAFVIWGDQAETELALIIRYVNVEESVKKPLGFIKSQIKLAWEASERGERPTFAELQPTKKRVTGRQEVIPDWFKEIEDSNDTIEPNEKEPDAEVEKKRQELQKKLNDMRKEKKGNN
ncbi:replication initiation protein [Sporosarcina aquimarina]|uniref:Replication initiation protein n=1 Tax=Sporosarcina aquimarina TaxID=114975 RepID=A0ABU4G3F6_9BACL|nr:replication initiation protein [Sporosarcina aquimarina]MDW0111514.1 replication initiation protein [Sporosarcina aquimarina]